MGKYPDAVVLKCGICHAAYFYQRDGKSLKYNLSDGLKRCECFKPVVLTGGIVGQLLIYPRTVVLRKENIIS